MADDDPGTGQLVALIAVSTALCLLIAYTWYRHVQFRDDEQYRVRSLLDTAITSTHKLDFHAAFVAADDFLTFGELRSYEELRDENLLVYRDSFEKLEAEDCFVIFLSHQWLHAGVPDPQGVHYAVMCAAVRQIAESIHTGEFFHDSRQNGLRKSRQKRQASTADATEEASAENEERKTKTANILSKVLVWVDYCSIPQTRCAMQSLSINTLPSYCAIASAFVVITPHTTTPDTALTRDFSTYQGRMWTRAEQFCHAATHGLDSMWIATSEHAIEKMASHKLLGMGDRWLTEVVHVFGGAVHDDIDRLSLVLPILGFYAELLACAEDVQGGAAEHHEHQQHARISTAPGRRSANGAGGTAQKKEMVHKMLELIQANSASVFPARMSVASTGAHRALAYSRAMKQGQRAGPPPSASSSGLQMAGAAPGGPSQTHQVELFGSLVPALERLLAEDAELRDTLRRQGLRRRGLAAKTAETLRASVGVGERAVNSGGPLDRAPIARSQGALRRVSTLFGGSAAPKLAPQVQAQVAERGSTFLRDMEV